MSDNVNEAFSFIEKDRPLDLRGGSRKAQLPALVGDRGWDDRGRRDVGGPLRGPH